jgi:hypothetical protein
MFAAASSTGLSKEKGASSLCAIPTLKIPRASYEESQNNKGDFYRRI